MQSMQYKTLETTNLDVIACSVDKHTTIIPGAWLDPVGLSNGAKPLQFAVADKNGVLRE